MHAAGCEYGKRHVFATGAAAWVAFGLCPNTALAVLISSPGHYIIDTRVDEVRIADAHVSEGVSIEVISGGVVEGGIRCAVQVDNCRANITVSGHGAVLGHIAGADGNVTLTDHARVGSAGAGWGAAVFVNDDVRLDAYSAATVGVNSLVMTGGYVGRNVATPEHVVINMSSGTIGSFQNPSGITLRMSGGTILDGVSGDGFFDVKDGAIWGGMSFGDYDHHSSVSGGAFNANSDEYLLRYSGSALTVTGGLFGNINQGAGLYFAGHGDISFWGRDLALIDGVLSGYLLDGSSLSVATTFNDRWRGTFTLHNVPEPSTFALLTVGLVGVGLARRRRPVQALPAPGGKQ